MQSPNIEINIPPPSFFKRARVAEAQPLAESELSPRLPTEIILQIFQHVNNNNSKLYPSLFLSRHYSATVKGLIYRSIDIILTTIPKLLACVASAQAGNNSLLLVKKLVLHDGERIGIPGSDKFNYYVANAYSLFFNCSNCTSAKFIIGRNIGTLALDTLWNPNHPSTLLLPKLEELEIESKASVLNVGKLGGFIRKRSSLTNLTVIANRCYTDDIVHTRKHYNHIKTLTFIVNLSNSANIRFLGNFTELTTLNLDHYYYYLPEMEMPESLNFAKPLSSLKSYKLEYLKIGVPELWHEGLALDDMDHSGNDDILDELSNFTQLKELWLSHSVIQDEICLLICHHLEQLDRIVSQHSATFTYFDSLPEMIESLEKRGKTLTIEFQEFEPGHCGRGLRHDPNILREQHLATTSGKPQICKIDSSWCRTAWPDNLSARIVRAYELDKSPQITFLPSYIFEAARNDSRFIEEERFCEESNFWD